MPVPPEWDLTGRTALVAGNGRGWAPVLASALAEAGAQVAVACAGSRGLEAARSALEPLGRPFLLLRADLTRREEVERAVGEVLGRWGRLDILVNNAPAEWMGPFLEASEEEFRRLLERNLWTAFHLLQVVGRVMVEQGYGRIIQVTSLLGERAVWSSTLFGATMGALHQLTRALALEWAERGVRINNLAPGWIAPGPRTPEEEAQDPLARYLPSRRLGRPEDLTALLVYLASPACDFATGETFLVDGGASAHP